MSGGAGSIGGSGGMGQQPMGNASAQPGMSGGMGGGMGSTPAPLSNPMEDTFKSQTTPGNFGQGLNAMFGTLGQPAGNASAQPQPFGMQPMQSPFQATQQPSPMGEMNAQPAVMPPMGGTGGMPGGQLDTQQKLNEAFARNLSGMQPAMPPGMQPGLQPGMPPGMQHQMPPGMQHQMPPGMQPGMQPAFGSGMPSDLQPGMPPGGQQVDQYTRQLGGLAPPTQVGQPLPPGFGRQLGADEQAPNPYLQERMRSLGASYQQPQGPQMPYGMSPLQNPFAGPNPYPAPGAIGQPSRPDLLKPMSQPPSGGIGALMPGMQQPQKMTKQQMRQQERMGPKQANPFQQQYM